MEGILILLGLYLVFRAFAKKSRTVLNTVKQQIEANTDGQTVVTPPPVLQKYSAKPFTTEQKREAQRRAAPQQQTAYTKTEQRLERTERQALRPTLHTDAIRDSYAGSLGGPVNEGRPSLEGAVMAEGKALPFGEGRPADAAEGAGMEARLRTAPDAQAAGNAAILPLSWSGNELVRSFIMGEILAKPHKRSDYHG